jgi:pimeloyl-ACP methyl ester carboxylesterase
MEKVLVDLSEYIKHVKRKYHYENVILAGWSGGGSLSSFYQAQAEAPPELRLKVTPAGDPIDLSGLVPAQAVLLLAAHSSRARIFTEWIDPSILDEDDPTIRDVELDLWNPKNPNKPPFTAEYLQRFHQAQVDRNRRITKWVMSKLSVLETSGLQGQRIRDYPFIVHCTQADPRRIDLTIDRNGRGKTSLADLASENYSNVGLARFTTCRSWLSQWSYDVSNADGIKCAAKITAPILVLENEADHLVPCSHPQTVYAAISHSRKRYVRIDKASHYYNNQPELMKVAVQTIQEFLKQYELLE